MVTLDNVFFSYALKILNYTYKFRYMYVDNVFTILIYAFLLYCTYIYIYTKNLKLITIAYSHET